MRSLYRVVVGQAWVSPSEFWAMAPGEIWWLLDAKNPASAQAIDAEELEELYDLMMDA